MTESSAETFRVDRFTVPEAARDEFLAQVADTHHILRTLPGFVRDAILEKPGGPGGWLYPHHRRMGQHGSHRERPQGHSGPPRRIRLRAQEFMAKLGVTPELASYRRLDISSIDGRFRLPLCDRRGGWGEVC